MHPFIKFRNTLMRKGLEAFGLFYGSYEGIVAYNEDPENRGRIKLKCPAAYGNNIFDKWALPKGMPLGKKIGLYFIPNPGDNVWVEFKNGNPEFPLWTYGWYAKDIDKNEAEPGKFLFFSKSGYKLLLDEINSKIRLYFNDKTELVLTEDKIHLFRDGKELTLDKDKVKLNFDNSELLLTKDKLAVNVNGVNLMEFIETLINIFGDGQMVGSAGPYVWNPATLLLVEKHIVELKKFMK